MNSYIFRKFTLLVAIKNSKCIGWELYETCGMKKDRLVYLCRNNKSVSWLRSHSRERNPGVLDDTSKPKFTRPETGKPCLI